MAAAGIELITRNLRAPLLRLGTFHDYVHVYYVSGYAWTNDDGLNTQLKPLKTATRQAEHCHCGSALPV